MTGPDTLTEYEEVELLLPWYVTGKLDAADRAKVEALLAREPALRRQLDLIREEQSAAIAVNEGVAAPAGLSVTAGMQKVAQTTSLGSRRAGRGLLERLRGFFTMPTAGAVRLAAAGALAVILLQAATIGALLPTGESYTTASGGHPAEHATAIVRFVDTATARSITASLEALDMTILDGPKPGGAFVVRIGPKSLAPVERAARVEALRKATGIVALVIP